jgi:hypothetical protein
VKVFRNGSLILTLPFTIVRAGFSVTTQETAGNDVTDSSGNLTCTARPSKSTFLTTDTAVWVYFSYDFVQQGDVFSYQWIHPSGAVDALQPTSTVGFTGNGCAVSSTSRDRIASPASGT